MSSAPPPRLLSVRHISLLSAGSDDRLVAMLEAVGAPLPRREIFTRCDEDFVTEEELAKALGRLVAVGRLERLMRPRFGKDPEAVFGPPGSKLPESSAEPSRRPPKPPREQSALTPAPAIPAHQEEAMPKGVYPRKKKKSAAAASEPAARPLKRSRRGPRRTPAPRAPVNGEHRFGYFSDGSLSIDCPECKGTLSEADLQALREFTRRFETAR